MKRDFIQTFTGKKFWLPKPDLDSICIEDIAHALSMQCRWAGHIRHFYSVAQHCYLASTIVPPDLALEALMHDASEAYLCDVPRPFKPILENYIELENDVMDAIACRFRFDWPLSHAVEQADYRLLCTEAQQLLPVQPDFSTREALTLKIEYMGPGHAESVFMRRFEELKSHL